MAESHGDEVFGSILGETVRFQRRLDDRGEISVLNVGYARPCDEAACEDAALVALAGLLDAVGGHEDRAGEGVELAALILPRTAVIPDEVGVFLQSRIAVGGQHFAVGVDIDPPASVCFRSSSRSFRSCPDTTIALPLTGVTRTPVGLGSP